MLNINIAAPNCAISPTVYDYGSINVGSESTPKNYVISNDGSATLNVTNLYSDNATEFIITSSPGTSFSLNPGQYQTMYVKFKPTTGGSRTGNIVVVSDDPAGTKYSNLSGIGVAASSPDIDVNPTSLNFNDITVNSSSDLTFQISNLGTATLNVTGLATTSNQYMFVSPPSVPFNILAGNSQTITVRFKPTSTGTKTGNVTITSNSPGETTRTVALTGNGVDEPAPEIDIIPASLSYGEIVVGSSYDKTFQIKNTGNKNLNVTGITLSSGEFMLVSPPAIPFSITAGNLQQIKIRFKPTSQGTKTANVIIANNDDDEYNKSVPLNGIGIPPESKVLGKDGGKLSGNIAEPVNTAIGNYTYSHLDISVSARGLPLKFERNYNSKDAYLGPLGSNWTHSYNILLTENVDSSVEIKWDDGHSEYYTALGSGIYTTSFAGYSGELQKSGSNFIFTKKDQTKYNFNSSGQLTSIVDKNNNTLTCSYSGDNLITVADWIGRTLSFTYDTAARILTLTDTLNRTYYFSYDTAGDLATFTNAKAPSRRWVEIYRIWVYPI
ncbi:MAG: choice-of-anchor D domain-containing protein, partial [bacterium]|nr:choice-of-anchor D domain-containing protein [bacterium]